MNICRKNFIVLLSLLFYQISLLGQIRMIFSLAEAQELFDSLDENALVVFDVDDTLIMALDKIRRKHPEPDIIRFKKTYFETKVQDVVRQEYFDSIKWKMAGQRLIEPMSAAIIKSLQSRNIRVITLTHMHAGAYYAIDSMQEWRYQQLYNLGIDVSIHNPTSMIFDMLPKGRTSHPLLHKGVLPTSRSCTKGQALAAFIKQLEHKPSQVIFFDDYMEHIETVHCEMQALGVPCTVFHYRATELLQEPIDIEIAQCQYDYLLEHHQWMSDEHAREMLLM